MKKNEGKYWKLAIAAVFSLAMGQATLAQGANLVVNGSFEAGYPGDFICGNWWYSVGWHSPDCRPERNSEWDQAIPGWRETGQGVNWYALGPDLQPVPPDGDHSIDLLGGGKGRIEQDVPTTPGTVYLLSFRYARHGTCSVNGVSATVTAGASSSLVTPTATGTDVPDWQVASFTFAGAPATTTTIAFESNQGNESGLCGGVLIDFVSVDSGAVQPPEPPPPLTCTAPLVLVNGACVSPPPPPPPPPILPPVITAFGVLADALVGVAYTHTFTAQGATPISWGIKDGDSLPAGLTLSSDGVLSGTPTMVGNATFTILAGNPGGSTPAVVNLKVVAAPPVINAIGTLTDAVVGLPYTHTFSATGTPPISWSTVGGALPAGLTLSSTTGVLTGTPTTAGVADFTIRATNAGGMATSVVKLTVVPAPPVIGAIGVLTDAVVGSSYTHTFTASGATPISWSIAAGALPAGLTLSSAGVLSGRPSTAGTATFTIRASNPGGATTAVVNLKVVPAVVVPPPMPKSKEECKKDGWRIFGVFRNQGDCVSYVETHDSPKSMPKTRDECKDGGWRRYGEFRNQGDCVSYVESLPKSRDDCRNDRWRGFGCYRDQGDCDRDADTHGRNRRRDR